MKAAVNGLATRYNIYETDGVLEDARLRLANNALCIADAALAEFNKRWPEEKVEVMPFQKKTPNTGAFFA